MTDRNKTERSIDVIANQDQKNMNIKTFLNRTTQSHFIPTVVQDNTITYINSVQNNNIFYKQKGVSFMVVRFTTRREPPSTGQLLGTLCKLPVE